MLYMFDYVDRHYKFEFLRIGEITDFLKLAGTLTEDCEIHMIVRRRMAIMSVTCFDNTSGRE